MDLNSLTAKQPVIVVGAAFGDVMLGLDRLPQSGGDEIAQELGRHIGGCAFNVARALARVGNAPINAIPVGNGSWGREVEKAMAQEGLPILLRHPDHDNGWCIAMVDATKERTFITVDGCEQYWSDELLAQIPMPSQALVYVSGYELVSEQSAPLRQWLLNLPNEYRLFVDFGPRLADIDAEFIKQLLAKQPILTLNRDELALLNQRVNNQNIDQGINQGNHPAESGIEEAVAFSARHNIALICRFDKDGAQICQPGFAPQPIPAFKVDVADTIAAGDSHCAGVLAGLSAGWTLETATTLGNMVAAIVVSRPGSDGAPSIDELRQFQAKHP
ncbi:ribokinase [Photobacterium sanctipauli]|uniref:Ribokinase n=1 Tax=Photobacterium sanctipauli TaxID=1342794 RepID=A0A2T3NPC5_9GAMM|nr:ribokinase [Photobacterium sanctipauli]